MSMQTPLLELLGMWRFSTRTYGTRRTRACVPGCTIWSKPIEPRMLLRRILGARFAAALLRLVHGTYISPGAPAVHPTRPTQMPSYPRSSSIARPSQLELAWLLGTASLHSTPCGNGLRCAVRTERRASAHSSPCVCTAQWNLLSKNTAFRRKFPRVVPS